MIKRHRRRLPIYNFSTNTTYQDISQLGEFVRIDQNDVPTTTSRTAAFTVQRGEAIPWIAKAQTNPTRSRALFA